MASHRLARLRRAGVICNKQIARLESLLAYQRATRDAIKAGIQAIAPEPWLPPPTRTPPRGTPVLSWVSGSN